MTLNKIGWQSSKEQARLPSLPIFETSSSTVRYDDSTEKTSQFSIELLNEIGKTPFISKEETYFTPTLPHTPYGIEKRKELAEEIIQQKIKELKENPTSTVLRFSIATIFFNQSRKKEAYVLVNEQIASKKDMAEALCLRGIFYSSDFNYGLAKEDFEESLKLDNNNQCCWEGWLMCEKTLNYPTSKETDILETYVAIHPEDAKAKFKLAHLLPEVESIRKEQLLRDASSEPALKLICHYLIANLYILRGQSLKAQGLYQTIYVECVLNENPEATKFTSSIASKCLYNRIDHFRTSFSPLLVNKVNPLYIELLDTFLARHPDDSSVLYYKGMYLLEHNVPAGALACAKRAVDESPTWDQGWLLMAKAYYELKHSEEALECAVSACKFAALDDQYLLAEVYNLIGELYIEQKNFHTARLFFTVSSVLIPQRKNLNGNIGYCIYKSGLGEYRKSVFYFIKEIKDNPTSFLSIRYLARCLMKMKHSTLSEKVLIEYYRISGGKEDLNLDVILLFAKHYYEQEDFEKSLAYYNCILEVNERDLKALLGKAAILEKQKSYLQLENVTNQLLETYPFNIPSWTFQVKIYIQKGLYDLAMQVLESIESYEELSANHYYLRGECHRGQTEFQLALETYHLALNLSLNPELTANIHQRIGLCHLDKLEYTLAISHFDDALKSPKNGESLIYRAYAHIQMKNFIEAQKDLIAAKKNGLDTYPYYSLTYGLYYYLQGKSGDAILYFTKWIKKNPNDWATVSLRAKIFVEHGLMTNAYDSVKTFLESNPDNNEAQVTLLEYKSLLDDKLKKNEDAPKNALPKEPTKTANTPHPTLNKKTYYKGPVDFKQNLKTTHSQHLPHNVEEKKAIKSRSYQPTGSATMQQANTDWLKGRSKEIAERCAALGYKAPTSGSVKESAPKAIPSISKDKLRNSNPPQQILMTGPIEKKAPQPTKISIGDLVFKLEKKQEQRLEKALTHAESLQKVLLRGRQGDWLESPVGRCCAHYHALQLVSLFYPIPERKVSMEIRQEISNYLVIVNNHIIENSVAFSLRSHLRKYHRFIGLAGLELFAIRIKDIDLSRHVQHLLKSNCTASIPINQFHKFGSLEFCTAKQCQSWDERDEDLKKTLLLEEIGVLLDQIADFGKSIELMPSQVIEKDSVQINDYEDAIKGNILLIGENIASLQRDCGLRMSDVYPNKFSHFLIKGRSLEDVGQNSAESIIKNVADLKSCVKNILENKSSLK